jgi:hypothetical protein
MQRGAREAWLPALAIVVIVLVVRSPVLLQSVADHDEALYLLVAREVLAGHLPYLTIWECKPPLFFFLIAGWCKLFGLSIVSYRFLADAAVIVTALSIRRIAAVFPARSRLVGFTAALTYIGLTVSDSGTASDAELFTTAFIALSAALLARAFARNERLRAGTAWQVGLFLACAAQIKETAALEALFFTVLAARAMSRDARAWAAFAAGGAAPIVAGALPYALSAQTPAYLDANLWSLLRRPQSPSHTPWLDVVRQQLEGFFSAAFLAAALPWIARGATRREWRLVTILLTWCLVDMLTVVAVGEYFAYQFLPLMLPASLLGAWALVRVLGSRASAAPAALCIALATILVHDAGQLADAGAIVAQRLHADPYAGDDTARIAAYLNARHETGTWLYVARDEPALYVLTGAPVPTRFPFPQHLIEANQERVAGVQGAQEIEHIFARAPRYVVFDGPADQDQGPEIATIARHLQRAYAVVYAIRERRVYQRGP